MPGKRAWILRHTQWLAQAHNIPFVLPAVHPFNPLPLLRLGVASLLPPLRGGVGGCGDGGSSSGSSSGSGSGGGGGGGGAATAASLEVHGTPDGAIVATGAIAHEVCSTLFDFVWNNNGRNPTDADLLVDLERKVCLARLGWVGGSHVAALLSVVLAGGAGFAHSCSVSAVEGAELGCSNVFPRSS